ncbi:MAG: NigD-like C-terminal domain-containing protein [Prolixibacteraceae bacterium]|jgi:hypothetical protein
MKPTFVSLLLSVLIATTACHNKEDVEIITNDSQEYVVLSYFNCDSLQTDPVTVISGKVDGDFLILTLQYGGGCKDHQVNLALILPECGTPPLPPPTFEIRHNANGDACKALITKEYSFNISGLRENGMHKTDFILETKNSSGEIKRTNYTYNY